MRTRAIIAFLLATATLSAARLDQNQINAYRVQPAIVRVVSFVVVQYSYLDPNRETRNRNELLGGTGSGFIINEEGYVVTNGHVVAPVRQYETDRQKYLDGVVPAIVQAVMGSEGFSDIKDDLAAKWIEARQFSITNAKVYKKVILSNGDDSDYEIKSFSPAIDEGGKDVAILKIEKNRLPVVMLGDSEKIELQDDILTVGYPAAADDPQGSYLNPKSNLTATVNNGKVSAKKMDVKGVPIIQTNAAISGGNSGGPAFNREREVIGITSFGSTQAQGFNFIIPINTVKEFIRDVGVEFNRGSAFNTVYYQALDAVWNEKWYDAERKVDEALVYMNNSPDLLALKGRVTAEKARLSWLTKMWYENQLVLILGVFFLLLVLVLLVMLLRRGRSRAGAVPVTPVPAAPPAAKPVVPPVADTRETSGAAVAETVVLLGSIEVLVGGQRVVTHPVTDRPLTIGRDPSQAEVVISEPIVSKLHCSVIATGEGVRIQDQGSTNGIYFGEERITEHLLRDGDEISLGKKGTVKLRYHV
ncbi:MAG TPA: trypsin-like peptidase domain-containing protein [Candidatus Aminicenantes bacterium]|nr:trypsin-like peptidase domain-containing protein [Candidatus Aminicenantes bacterium]